MRNIIRLTNDFILRAGVHALPLRIDDLAEICKHLGYQLMPYQHAEGALRKLGMEQYITLPAFTVCIGDSKAVLFDSTLSTGTRIFAIAHEIGHIVLQHNYNGVVGFTDVDSDQEREANAFAYQLIAPLCILSALDVRSIRDIQSETLLDRKRAKIVQKHLRTYQPQPRADELVLAYGVRRVKHEEHWSIYIIAFTMLIVFCAVLIAQRSTILQLRQELAEQEYLIKFSVGLQKNDEPVSEIISMKIASPSDTVYITEDGKRYHKDGCFHIKNSTTTKAVPRINAESDGYTPCKDCYE